MTWWLAVPFGWWLAWYWPMPTWAVAILVCLIVIFTPKCLTRWWEQQAERCRYPAIIMLTVYGGYQFIGTLMIVPSTEMSRIHALNMLIAVFIASWLYVGRPK